MSRSMYCTVLITVCNQHKAVCSLCSSSAYPFQLQGCMHIACCVCVFCVFSDSADGENAAPSTRPAAAAAAPEVEKKQKVRLSVWPSLAHPCMIDLLQSQLSHVDNAAAKCRTTPQLHHVRRRSATAILQRQAGNDKLLMARHTMVDALAKLVRQECALPWAVYSSV